MSSKGSLTAATTSASVTTLPPRIGSLTGVNHVRKELAAVYRDARQGVITAAQASKLTYILYTLAQLIEQAEFEARLNSLESRIER